MVKLKYVFFLLVFIVLISVQSCSRKADDDEEIKTMIVGTWKARVHNTTFRDKYHIMEFTYDGRYRELTREGSGNDYDGWNSADTTRYKGFDLYIAFGDSVYYYIENSTIKFYTSKSKLPYANFVPEDIEVDWIKPDKLKFIRTKYEKI